MTASSDSTATSGTISQLATPQPDEDHDGMFWCVVTPVAEIRGRWWGVVEVVCTSWDQAIGMCDHSQELIPVMECPAVEDMLPMPAEGQRVLEIIGGADVTA